MNTYIADSNIFLRFILKDHPSQFEKACKYFRQAKHKEIRLIFLSETVIEIEYVIRKYYKLDKETIAYYLINLIVSPYIDVKKRDILLGAVRLYKRLNVDLIDAFLFKSAEQEKGSILSFDKDFRKLKTYAS